MRDFTVQRIALRHELGELATGVRCLQQRAVAVVARAVPEFVDARSQVDHGATGVERCTVRRIEHGAAAGCEDHTAQSREFVDHCRLAGTESGLALDIEDDRNLDARACLDLVVGVEEGEAETLREQLADRRLAGAHETHEEDVARCRRVLCFGRCRVFHGSDSSARSCAEKAKPRPWPGLRVSRSAGDQRSVRFSLRIRGVTNTSSSRRSLNRRSLRNRKPMIGMSPSRGILLSCMVSSCV